MRATALFFAYLCVCLALAALATPPLMETGWIALEPQRVMGRMAQAFILLGIWPLLGWLRLGNRAALGYDVPPRSLGRALVLGWLVGVLILLALVAMLILLGVRVPEARPDTLPAITGKAVQALVGGLMIGVLEETFFRGALYTAIRQREGLSAALIWSSLLYAVLHFMRPAELPPGATLDGMGAFWMFTHAFIDLFQWRNLDSIVSLFLVGVLLALVRERRGQIGWCIGLHAGWVFVIQVTRKLTDGNAASGLAFLVGDYDGIIGWLAAVWIGALAALFWAWSDRGSRAGRGAA